MTKRAAVLALLLLAACGGKDPQTPPPAPDERGYRPLAAEEVRHPLPDGGYFTWRFSEKPKLGTIILKVQVFNKAGGQEQPYELTGEYGMPSMRYHDSGPVKFQLSKKGDYLLPVNIVMAGEWEVAIRIKRGKDEVYAGKTLFAI